MKNEFQKESLRQLLQAQKVQLIEKIKLERGGATSRSEAAVAELEAVEQALKRIALGEYGRCHVCEVEIPITRLLAFPSTKRCIVCQSAREKTAGPDAA